jgi:lambda family phage tail tape measure protein
MEQANVLNARRIEMTLAQTAATEAQTVANEAQAATGIGATLGRGMASAGRGLMALAGGPWGLAIAGVAGLGYAIYDLKKKAEEWKQGTEAQVKSLGDLRTQVQAATDDFNKLHSSMTLASTVKLFTDSNEELAKKRAELADLEQQVKDLQKAMSYQGGGGPLAGMHLQELNDRIEKLQGQIPPTTDEVNKLGTELSGSLVPAIDAAKGAFDRLRAGASLSSIFSGFSADVDKGIKQIDDAKKKANELMDKLSSQGTDWAEQAATKGMNHVQLAKHELDQIIASIKAQKLPEGTQAGQIGQATAEAQKSLQAAAIWDAANTKHKQGVDKLGNAYQSLMKTMREKVAADQEEMAGGSKLTDADKNLLKVKQDLLTNLRNLSPQRKQALLDEAQQFVNLTNEIDARKKKNAEIGLQVVLQQKLSDMANRQTTANARSLEGVGHGSQWNQQRKQLEMLQDTYAKTRTEEVRLYSEGKINAEQYSAAIGTINAAEQDAIGVQRQFFADQAVAQANWKNGLTAALEDVRSTGANVAGQFQSLFTNAFSGMNDALANFVKTGKLNFTSLAQSFISDMLRIELQIAESKVLTAMFGDGTKGSSGFLGTLASFFGGSTTANANGGVYSSPGLSAHSGSVVSSPTMFAFAAGAGLMGEAGPEAIMPLSRGSDGKLGVKAQIGSNEPAAPIVNISIIGAPSQPTMSTSRGADGSINIEAKFEEMLANSMMNRKRGAQAMEHVYGLGRGGQSFG